MKLFAVILLFALFFGYTFIQSGAWDVQVTTADKEGVEVAKRRHTIYWDRYFAYLKNLPKKVFKSAEKAVNPEPKK